MDAATTGESPFMGKKLGKPAAPKRRAGKSEKVTPKVSGSQQPDLTALDRREETARKPLLFHAFLPLDEKYHS